MDNKKIDVMYLSKDTLICYLLNELGNGGAWKVTTHLGDNGEWLGKIEIQFVEEYENDNNDLQYFKAIANMNTYI